MNLRNDKADLLAGELRRRIHVSVACHHASQHRNLCTICQQFFAHG